MSARAEQLAQEFAQANDALVQVLEQATPEQWRQRTRDEGELRPIGVIAHHVAWAHQHINQRVRAFAEGLPVIDRALIQQRYNAFAAACRAAGRRVTDFDVCKMTFMAVAPDSAAARRMLDELATRSTISPEALAVRTVVGTPDVIVEHLRALTEIGVNHHVFNVAESAQWPKYWEALELLSREVVPRVRQQ